MRVWPWLFYLGSATMMVSAVTPAFAQPEPGCESLLEAPALTTKLTEAYRLLLTTARSGAVKTEDLQWIKLQGDPFQLKPNGPSHKAQLQQALDQFDQSLKARGEAFAEGVRARLLTVVDELLSAEAQNSAEQAAAVEIRDDLNRDLRNLYVIHDPARKLSRGNWSVGKAWKQIYKRWPADRSRAFGFTVLSDSGLFALAVKIPEGIVLMLVHPETGQIVNELAPIPVAAAQAVPLRLFSQGPFVAGLGGERIYLWNVATGRAIGTKLKQVAPPGVWNPRAVAPALAISPTGQVAAVDNTKKGEVRVTDLTERPSWTKLRRWLPAYGSQGEKIYRPKGMPPFTDLSSTAFSADGKILFFARANGEVWRWEYRTSRPAEKVLPGRNSAKSVSFSDDGRFFAVRVERGEERHSLEIYTVPDFTLADQVHDAHLIELDEGFQAAGDTMLWRSENGFTFHSFKSGEPPVQVTLDIYAFLTHAALSADGTRLFTGHREGVGEWELTAIRKEGERYREELEATKKP